jgi:hypothetical protein
MTRCRSGPHFVLDAAERELIDRLWRRPGRQTCRGVAADFRRLVGRYVAANTVNYLRPADVPTGPRGRVPASPREAVET